MKLVLSFISERDTETPVFLPASMHLSIQAIFLARFLIVCIPSRSCLTSSGVFPCTIFQYEDVTIGICIMEKYLFITSKDAVVPALLADITDAPGFLANAAPPA